jgi:tetratricopeptide (TPR) repeat protein
MREGRADTDIGVIMVAPQDTFDKIIEWLIISLLAFMPLAFGAVEAWSEQVVVVLAAAICICFLLKLVVREDTHLVWSWAYVPAALFVLVAVFQLIPLPSGLIGAISPGTATIKKELLGDLPNADSVLSPMTLSFYTCATKHDLRLILSVAAVFFVVVNVLRTTEQIKRLLAAIAIVGGSIAVLALAQDLFGNGKIYWFVPSVDGQAYSGPFINHSHYGQFMNLSIGAALGLILVKIHEAFTRRKVTPPVVFEFISSPAAKMTWFLTGVAVIGAATIFVSLTRGGMVAMLIAGAFTTLVLSSRGSVRGRGWAMVLMALGAFICVLYIGFDAVYDRLATLRELHEAQSGRWQIVKDISLAWTKFPVFGTGLGTHEVVYPMFDRSTIPALAAHAENEYAQAAEETGLVGLGALAGFGIIVWVNYVRNIKSSYIPIRSAAYGLGFGLLAIMLQSLSDFGQHLPANAGLSAVCCALLVVLARIGHKGNPAPQAARAMQLSRPLRVAALVCISGVWIWAAIGANNARLAEAHWKQALLAEDTLLEQGWAGTDEQYRMLISSALAASEYQPDNIKYRHWLNVYRWHSISRITDPNTGDIMIPHEAVGFTERIVDELHQARILCPAFGATYCIVGQLERSVLGQPIGAEHIETGYRLAPCDPTACFLAGSLDAQDGRADSAFVKLSRTVQLDGRLFNDVAAVCMNDLNRPDLAVAIAGENTGWLSNVANMLTDTKDDKHKALAEQARAQVIELLKLRAKQPDAPASVFASLGNIYRRENNNEAAIEHYRRALALDYGQVGWRMTLAGLLADAGSVPEAIHEARICLRLSPQLKAAEKLIADLSVRPDAIEQQNPTP